MRKRSCFQSRQMPNWQLAEGAVTVTASIYCLSLVTPAGKEPWVVSFLSLRSGTGLEGTTPEGKDPEAVGTLSLIFVVFCGGFGGIKKEVPERPAFYIFAPLDPAAATESLNSVTKVRCLCRWKFVERGRPLDDVITKRWSLQVD